MSYNYTQFVAALAQATKWADGQFISVLPNIIDQAEQQCYRDLDLLDTRTLDNSATLTANSRTFTLPQTQGRFVVVELIAVFTSVQTTLIPISPDTLLALWQSEQAPTTPSVPEFYALLTSQLVLVGPPPDAAYGVAVHGTVRPATISVANPTTLLSLYVPDLFFAAALCAAANINQQAADLANWKATYTTLLTSARAEEFRKKFAGSAWSSLQTPPEAQPPRS